MNLPRGWRIVAVVALAWQPALADDGDFSRADGTLISPEVNLATNDQPAEVTYTGAGSYPGNPGPIAYIDFLHWGAHRQGMDVAVVGLTDGEIALGVAELGFGRDGGLRIGLGYQFASGWDVSWNYTYFSTDASLALQPTADNPIILSQSMLNGFQQFTEGDFTFAARLNYHVNDLEFGRWINIDESTAFRLFGGFRWAIIDQRISSRFGDAGDDDFWQQGETYSGTGEQTINMDGYGLRLGSEGRWNVGRGFSLFGKGSASVLAGHFNYRFTETGTEYVNGVVVDTNTLVARDTQTQLVPVLEVAAGVNWAYKQLELSAGYELAGWFNMATRIGGAGVSVSSNDLLLDGFFLRGAYTR
jgi:hypothetical protein